MHGKSLEMIRFDLTEKAFEQDSVHFWEPHCEHDESGTA